jgi:ribose 5-phosphate isomerase B
MPNIFIASDHAGFALKNALISHIHTLGYDVVDMGAFTSDPEDDYPDFITPCAKRVASEPDSRGIIIGGSGQGEAMCANRISGIRAAVFYTSAHVGRTTSYMENGVNEMGNDDIVRLAREHNDANVLSLGARFISEDVAREAVRIFLETKFSGDERHRRRLTKF